MLYLKTKEQLAKLTKKEIISIPFWVDQSIWKSMENKRSKKKIRIK